jgi:hypothetical protein
MMEQRLNGTRLELLCGVTGDSTRDLVDLLKSHQYPAFLSLREQRTFPPT